MSIGLEDNVEGPVVSLLPKRSNSGLDRYYFVFVRSAKCQKLHPRDEFIRENHELGIQCWFAEGR